MPTDEYLFDDQYTETENKELSLSKSISEGLTSLIGKKKRDRTAVCLLTSPSEDENE